MSHDASPRAELCQCGAHAARTRLRRSLAWRVLSLPAVLVTWVFVGLIRVYQRAISPALASRCRFTPSCSSYALQSLQKNGLLKGSAKAAWRLLRCNPFCRGGHDPP